MNNSPSSQLHVLVVHPDPIVSAGVVAALRAHPSIAVCVRDVEEPGSGEPSADVVITDYDHAMRLAGRGTRAANGGPAESRILALTVSDRESDIRRAIQTGIHGYLLLGGSLDELIDAVRAVGMGMRYVCPIVAQRMADSLAGEMLTHRENEVLRLVATGQSNKAIARQLTIELGTVKSHVSAIMMKLGAISRTQAANIAVTRGLVDERKPYQIANHLPHVREVEAQPQFA